MAGIRIPHFTEIRRELASRGIMVSAPDTFDVVHDLEARGLIEIKDNEAIPIFEVLT